MSSWTNGFHRLRLKEDKTDFLLDIIVGLTRRRTESRPVHMQPGLTDWPIFLNSFDRDRSSCGDEEEDARGASTHGGRSLGWTQHGSQRGVGLQAAGILLSRSDASLQPCRAGLNCGQPSELAIASNWRSKRGACTSIYTMPR